MKCASGLNHGCPVLEHSEKAGKLEWGQICLKHKMIQWEMNQQMFTLRNREETEQFRTDSYAERYRHERRQIDMIWEPDHPLTKWEKHNPYMGYTFKDATRAMNETRHVHDQGICMCKGKCG